MTVARYYQREAVAAVLGAFEDHRGVLLPMATGLGKTECFGMIIKDWPGRVLVLAHVSELVEQAKARLERMTGEAVEVEKAERSAYIMARIVVGSIQSVQKQNRLERLAFNPPTLIVFDEAHHSVAKTFRRPMDRFPNAKLLGVTATTKPGLDKLFTSIPYQMGIWEGIELGYLVPLVGQRVHLDKIDLSRVGKSKGDFNQSQLDNAIVEAVEGIVSKTLELYPDRRGPCFFPGVKSAQYAAERFNALRPGSAVCVHGGSEDEEREEAFRAFKNGDIHYLCNCNLVSEGIDIPGADMVVMGRPTLSQLMYTQWVGRGTRALPGVVDQAEDSPLGAPNRRAAIKASAKPDTVILDFVGNAGKHDLAALPDILGGDFTPAERKKAKAIVAGVKAIDGREALREARSELQRMAREMAAKVAARVETVNLFPGRSPHDALATLHIQPDPRGQYAFARDRERLHPWQETFLARIGVDSESIATYTRSDAQRIFRSVKKRRELGLATYKQLKTLRKYGFDNPNISFERAGAAITYLREGCGWLKSRVDSGRLRMLATGKTTGPRQYDRVPPPESLAK